MRTLYLALLFCTCAFLLNGQKVDIDKYRIYVEYASLPKHKVSPDARTYSLDVSGKYKFDKAEIEQALNLRGWELVEADGDVHVKLKMQDFVRGKSSSKKRTEKQKDKDGKVTGSTTYYTYSSKNTGRASLYIYGPKNPFVEKKKDKGKKKKSKRDKKKEAEAKKKADNPFLAGVDDLATEEAEESELVAKFDLTQNYEVKSKEYTSSKKAYNDYNDKANNAYSEQLDGYQSDVINRANYYLNQTYGYNKQRDYAKFKRLDSKKHPEYQMFDNATTALKEIFSKKKFNRNYDELTGAINPIAEYYKTVVEKYNKDDKHPKRLKAAAMYNLGQIYYYTDQPDKVIEIGNQYIAWGHDKKDGEKFVKKAQKLHERMIFHEVSGRFFETSEDADAIESEDFEAEEGGN